MPATTGSPTTLGSGASWYVLARSNLSAADDTVTIGAANISYTGTNGFAVIGNQYLTHGSINFTDVTATVTNSGAGGGINGLGTHSTVAINGNNFTLTSNSTYTGGNSSGGVASYAILAGSSVISGEGGASAANNGKFSTITLNNATIDQTTAGGLVQPVLNAGLRAIQGAYLNAGNGSSGKIVINGTLDMTLTGERVEGIYISGAASDSSGNEAVSQVILNDSNIHLIHSGSRTFDSSAIKIGKTRAVGTGKGELYSNGAMTIIMDPAFGGSQPYWGAAIKMSVSGSKLMANGPNSSTNILASRSALAIGIDDWGASVDSGGALGPGIIASFGDATIRTQSTTAPLLLIDGGQQDVQLLFNRQSDLLAASDGYILDVINYRNVATPSSVQATFDNGTTITGLVNKTYANSTVDLALSNGSTWNLAEKTTGAVATSTFDTLTMTNDSTLNAFKGGAGAFIMIGDVSSTASTISLSDGVVGDRLTIQGDYVGDGAVLKLDTYMASDGSPSDVLVIDGGTATGSTEIQINNVNGPGALTQADGILVVDAINGATTSDTAFHLNGAISVGAYDYNLYYQNLAHTDQSWYLRSTQELAPTSQTTLPYADVLSHFAQATLGTLQQRTGNRIWPNGTPAEAIWCKDPTQNFRCTPTAAQNESYARGGPTLIGQGAWGRIGGQYSSFAPRTGSAYTQSIGFMQAGYEGVAKETAWGDLTLGAYATIGTSTARIDVTRDPVTGAARSKGKITTTGYGVGANMTWLGNDGLYADAIAQFTWYDSSLSNKNGHNQGWSSAASLEVGKRYELGSGWAVVPQAQLAWTHVDFSSFTDNLGNRIALGKGDSLQGRAGVRLENLSVWQDANGQPNRLQFYGIVNLTYEFLNGTSVKVAGTSLVQGNRRLWGEAGVGATYSWNKNWSAYGEADYAMALSGKGGDNYTVKGTAGLRYRW
ncbi:autotransporter family protein [Labrys miyagiensis]